MVVLNKNWPFHNFMVCSQWSPSAASPKVNTVCERPIIILVILQLAGHILQPSPVIMVCERAIITLVILQLVGHLSKSSSK